MAARTVALLALAGITASRRVSAGEKYVVTQKGKRFSAEEIHVKVGDVVEFKNDDDVAHNVFSISKIQPFNTQVQTPGTHADVTFKSEGTIEVRCAIHPKMKLFVRVEK